MKIKFLLLSGIALVMAVALAGCNYKLGNVAHPQIKTIAIAPVINETTAYNASAQMRGMLCDQFMFDGSLKIKDLNSADCILYAKILELTSQEVMDQTYNGNQTYRPAEWKLTIKAEYSVILPGRKDALVEKRVVEGSANYQVQADQETNKQRGIMMACRDAAQKMVQYTTEAF
jgi:outer membrane lipopolysaccharide assembly protein LptE/RlpB